MKPIQQASMVATILMMAFSATAAGLNAYLLSRTGQEESVPTEKTPDPNSPPDPVSTDIGASGVAQAKRQGANARALVRHHWDDAVQVAGIGLGPSGLVELELAVAATDTRVRAYMTPDAKHLIVGEMISPYQESAKERAQEMLAVLIDPRKAPSPTAPDPAADAPDPGGDPTKPKPSGRSTPAGTRPEPPTKPVKAPDSKWRGSLIPGRKSFDQEKFLEITRSAHGFWEGQPDAIPVSAYYDPDCSACASAHRGLKPYIASGDIRVKWIPVAPTEDSLKKSAAILAAPTAVRASVLQKVTTRVPAEELDWQPEEVASEEAHMAAVQQVIENNRAFNEHSEQPGTPTIVWHRNAGPVIWTGYSKQRLPDILREGVTPPGDAP